MAKRVKWSSVEVAELKSLISASAGREWSKDDFGAVATLLNENFHGGNPVRTADKVYSAKYAIEHPRGRHSASPTSFTAMISLLHQAKKAMSSACEIAHALEKEHIDNVKRLRGLREIRQAVETYQKVLID